MVVLQEKGMQKLSRGIILRAAVYDAVIKITVISIQYINKECMTTINQKNVILVNDETSMSNPDVSTIIYFTAAKVAQCGLLSGNRRKKEEKKRETSKKIANRKLHLQKNRCEDIHKCQDSINSILFYPAK